MRSIQNCDINIGTGNFGAILCGYGREERKEDMQSQGNIRVVEMLRYLYQHTDENHPATVTDITAYLKERGIQAVRQTVYADLNALITAGFDIVIVKSTQNQFLMMEL